MVRSQASGGTGQGGAGQGGTGPVARQFPRRDAAGRVANLRELVVAGAAWTVLAWAGLTVIDALLALAQLTSFGSSSGWLAMILPALLYFDDIRAWRGFGVRFLVAVVGATIAIGLGLLAAAALVTSINRDYPRARTRNPRRAPHLVTRATSPCARLGTGW